MGIIRSLFLLVACLGLACQTAFAADRTHHTFRYVTSSGYPNTFNTMTFSPDSSQLAVAAAGKVDFINTSLGRVTGQYKLSPFAIGYSKDASSLLMLAGYGSVLLDTLTGSKQPMNYQVEPGYLGIRLERINGKLLITQIESGSPVMAAGGIQVEDELIGVAEGRHGYMRRVTGQDPTRVVETLKGAAGAYVQLKVLPRGTFGEESAKVHLVRRMPAEVNGESRRFKEIATPDIRDNLVICQSKTRQHEFRNAGSGSLVAQLETIEIKNVGQIAVSPDQKKFAVVSQLVADSNRYGVEVFDIATQRRLAFMHLPQQSYLDIGFAADNNHVLVGTWDSVEIADTARQEFVGRLNLGWQPEQKVEKKESGSGGTVTGAAVRSTADAVADGSRSSDRSPIRLVWKMAVSPKNIVATADGNGIVNLWDLRTGELLEQMPKNPGYKVKEMMFSPDGKWLAYHVEGTLHLVDVADLEPRSTDDPALPLTGNLGAAPQATDAQTPDAPAPELVVEEGAKVEVFSRGRWYPAVIVREEATGRWQIHYDDSPKEWDELVTRQRLRSPADR